MLLSPLCMMSCIMKWGGGRVDFPRGCLEELSTTTWRFGKLTFCVASLNPCDTVNKILLIPTDFPLCTYSSEVKWLYIASQGLAHETKQTATFSYYTVASLIIQPVTFMFLSFCVYVFLFASVPALSHRLLPWDFTLLLPHLQ